MTDKEALTQIANLRAALQRIIDVSPRCDSCSATHTVIVVAEAALAQNEKDIRTNGGEHGIRTRNPVKGTA